MIEQDVAKTLLFQKRGKWGPDSVPFWKYMQKMSDQKWRAESAAGPATGAKSWVDRSMCSRKITSQPMVVFW